jgi:NADPH-dependent 2,4-dienoyl-CoA reductase/sulfur reductase-like enzyme
MNKPTRKKPRPPKPRTRVLVILSSNGFVEVFAEREVDVHIAQGLHVETIEGERLAEEFLDGTLPKRFRELFLPGMLRATGLVERITPERALYTLWQLEILKGLRELREAKSPAAVPAVIQRRRAAM